MSGVMIDTNVLVYARDAAEPAKGSRAHEVLAAVGSDGVLSTQILGEYFTVVRRKFVRDGSVSVICDEIETMAAAYEVLPVTLAVTRAAMRGVQEHGLAFYDAQIWAAARLNDISVILTEDFCHGREVEGVRYVNPFRDDFALPEIGVG